MTDVVYTTQPAYRTRSLYRGTQVVWYLFYALETLLLFRFVLRLLSANPGALFTQIIYGLTYPFVYPFQAVFINTRVLASTFEWTTLLAMLVYYILAWAIVRLFTMGRPISTTEADYKLNRQDVVE
jgi:hypothetical protein